MKLEQALEKERFMTTMYSGGPGSGRKPGGGSGGDIQDEHYTVRGVPVTYTKEDHEFDTRETRNSLKDSLAQIQERVSDLRLRGNKPHAQSVAGHYAKAKDLVKQAGAAIKSGNYLKADSLNDKAYAHVQAANDHMDTYERNSLKRVFI